jgi:hypothetical protein
LPPRELSPDLLRIVDACAVPALWQRRQLALDRLIQVQPNSDMASAARLKMLQMLSSDELQAWRNRAALEPTSNQSVGSLRNDTGNTFNRSASSLTPFDVVPASATAEASGLSPRNPPVVAGAGSDSSSQVNVATFVTPAGEAGAANSLKSNLAQSDLFFKTIDSCYKSDLYLANLPQLELMRDAITRNKVGGTRAGNASHGLIESIIGLSGIAGWPQVAKQELMLSQDRPEQLRWVGFAVATSNRPLLDGVLDEPMWAACPPMKLTHANPNAMAGKELPATVRWSFDDRYLYIAIDSPREAQATINSVSKPRKYDSDLDAADHIHFVLDTDRDYASAVELGVSSEGETFDRCCGLPQYNPQYAVAIPRAPLSNRWIAEIAIPIADLTTRADLTSEAWAVSAHRRSSKGDTQSWSSMSSEQPLFQSAGLLLFVQPPGN